MKKLILYLMVALLITINGCKKDEEEKGIQVAKMKLIERLDKLDVPAKMKNSSNSNAQTAVGYVDMVKDVENYFMWFNIPEDAMTDNSKSTLDGDVYTWTYGDFTIWETYKETASKHIWQIDVNMGEGRQKYLYSEEDVDGGNGLMEVYDYSIPNGSYVWKYEWGFDANDNALLVWKDAAETFRYEVKSNADLSGYAKLFGDGSLVYHFLWNVDGSGSYSYYDNDGSVLLTESWLVSDL